MTGGARGDVLPLLSVGKAKTVEKHSLRGASHASREGRSTRKAGDWRYMARSMNASRARGATWYKADRDLEGSTVIADGDTAGAWHKDSRRLVVKLMLETKRVTHDTSRVKDVKARGQHDHVGDPIALRALANLQVHQGNASSEGASEEPQEGPIGRTG